MHIFIAGATGTLGAPLARQLIARGHSVTGLTRSPSKTSQLEQLGASAVVGDALNARALEQAVASASPECVVHALSALPKNGPMRAADLKATNVLRTTGTANLFHAAIAAGAQRFVGESMILSYGFGDHGSTPLTETAPLQEEEPKPWLQDIVDATRSLEEQLQKADEEGAIDAVALRYGLFYGGGCLSTQYMLRMIGKRMMPTVSGKEGVVSWVHLEDAVTATVAAIEQEDAHGIYNIVDDEPVSMNEWIRRAAEALDASSPWSIPSLLLRILAPYLHMMFSSRLPVDNSKAKHDFSWSLQFPTTREGLQTAAAHPCGPSPL